MIDRIATAALLAIQHGERIDRVMLHPRDFEAVAVETGAKVLEVDEVATIEINTMAGRVMVQPDESSERGRITIRYESPAG